MVHRFAMIFAMIATPALAARPPRPDPTAAVAAAAQRSGQVVMAAKLYRDATRANPTDATAWTGLGEALASGGRAGEALAAFERAGELGPATPGLARLTGRAQLGVGQIAAAETSFRRATTTAPADARGWVGLGVALDLQRRHADAQAAYAAALRIDPLDRAARNNLALSIALDGRSAAAVLALAPWAVAADSPPRLRANLALLRAAAGGEQGLLATALRAPPGTP